MCANAETASHTHSSTLVTVGWDALSEVYVRETAPGSMFKSCGSKATRETSRSNRQPAARPHAREWIGP
eukprot:11097455-Alexandrium_andersonii.AAC.1